MYKIEKTDYGYKLTFDDFVVADEMKAWREESAELLSGAPGQFGVLVDMRTLIPLSVAAQEQMQEGQKLYRSKGMLRSVVILDSVVTTMQFQRIGRETGIGDFERYIDASSVANWEQVGVEWITKGIDPGTLT